MRLRRRLAVGNDVRIRLFDAFYLVDFRNHNVGQRSFILRRNEEENVRLAEAGMGLFHTRELLQ